ncbi:MAG TPA: Wzz/FepE/Etk N-terminal domain-containing protein, partial [Segetibacter sp.]
MNTSLSLSDLNSTQSRLSTKETLLKYFIYLPLFIISIILAVGISFVYIRYKTPTYVSSMAVFFPEGNKGSNASSNDMQGLDEIMMFNKKVNLSNEIQIMKTKLVMARVVKKLNLNLQYYIKGKIKKSELYNSHLVKASVLAVKDSSKSETI